MLMAPWIRMAMSLTSTTTQQATEASAAGGRAPARHFSLQRQISERHRLVCALLILASGVLLYLQLFTLPATPRAPIGDQSIYLHSAARMYDGQLIYRDYDQFTFPCTDLLYLFLFKLFGLNAYVSPIIIVMAGMASTWLCIFISSKVLHSSAAFLPALLFLTLPFSSNLDATHHLFSALAAAMALGAALEKKTMVRVTLAGAFWAIGTCFTQSLVIGFLAFALLLTWEYRRRGESWAAVLRSAVMMFGSYAVVLFACNAYFLWNVGLRQFGYLTGIFILKNFQSYRIGGWSTYLRGWPSVHKWANWPDLLAWPLIHAVVPLVYLIVFIAYWKRKRGEPDHKWPMVMLVNVTGFALFLTVASAPAWNRLYAVSMPALIMLVWLLQRPIQLNLITRRVLWGTVLVLAVVRPVVTQTRSRCVLALPIGSTAFFDRGLYVETKWMLEKTHPGDYFFGDQLLSFELKLRNPARVAYVTPFAFTTPEEIENVVHSLERYQVNLVSWYPGLDDPQDVQNNHLAPLRQYLNAHYKIAQRFPNGHVIWERDNAKGAP
jgi:hypothetical protein